MKRWILLVSCWLVTFALSAQERTETARQRALGHLYNQILPNLSRDGRAYWLFNEHGQPRRIKYDGGLDSKCFCSDNLFGVPRREIKGEIVYAKRKLHHYLGYAQGEGCDEGCHLFMGDSIVTLFSKDELAASSGATDADAGKQRILISLSSAFCGQGYCAVRIALASRPDYQTRQIYFYLVMKSTNYSLADWWYIVPQRVQD